jgi:beta-xylosidase
MIALIMIVVLAMSFYVSPVMGQEKPGKLAPKPLYRDPVYDAPTDPVLCFNTQENKWFMFYTARRATEPNTPGVTWVHGSRIGIAESADGGATWTYRGTAEIDYSHGLPEYTYWAPEVIYYDGIYHMYLSFVPGIFTNWDHPREIVHLTSKDMLKWKYESTLDLKSDKVIDACVTQLPNGTWRMWYKDERQPKSLSYADSPDLYQWQTRGNAISDRNGEGPKVFHWKGHYWMVPDLWQGLGVYRSDDCLNWTPQKNNLLSEGGQDPTDRGRGSHGDVVVSGDRAYLFYFTGLGREATEPNDPYARRRDAIQVVELEYKDGQLTCDRNKPTYIQLLPQLEEEK